LQHRDEKSAPPTPTELAAYHRTWTDTALQSLRDNAEAALSDYAQKVVQAARPVIEAEALRRGRPVWKDILIAVASAFTYSLLLLLAALIIRFIGIDLVDVAHGGRHDVQPAPVTAPLPRRP
jgi:hypothetical protein